MNDLPDEPLLIMFSFLNRKERDLKKKVCSRWYEKIKYLDRIEDQLNLSLISAAYRGSIEEVKAALDQGANIEAQQILEIGGKSVSGSALHFACQRAAVEIVQFLLAKGANPNSGNHEQNTPLLVTLFNFRAGTPIFTGTMQFLLMKGADPYHENQDKISPLSYIKNKIKAIQQGEQSEIPCDLYYFIKHSLVELHDTYQSKQLQVAGERGRQLKRLRLDSVSHANENPPSKSSRYPFRRR